MKRSLSHFASLFTLITLALLLPNLAHATLLYVPTRQYPDIQSAIDAAQTGDKIVVAPGHYKLSKPLDPMGKRIVIGSASLIVGAASSVILDGQYQTSIFIFHSGEMGDTRIGGFHLINSSGPAIQISNRSSPSVGYCGFQGDSSGFTAGGIDIQPGCTPSIDFCVFNYCSGTDAGAISCSNSAGAPGPKIANCTFADNQGDSGAGAINFQGGVVSVANCTFSHNACGSGDPGAILCSNANATISICTFDSNSCSGGNGGAVRVEGASGVNTVTTIRNSTFTNNLTSNYNADGAGCGGALSLQAPASVKGCSFYSNVVIALDSAPVLGGAVYINASPVTLTDCDFSYNSATGGGALEIDSVNPVISGCEFFANQSSGSTTAVGGGAVGIITTVASAYPIFKGCLFDSNAAQNGGALGSAGSPTLTDCVFDSNLGIVDGGAIYATSGTLIIVCCAFTANNAATTNGGALCCTNETLFLTNVSFALNTAYGTGDALYAAGGNTITVNNTLIWDTAHRPGSDFVWDGAGSLTMTYSDDYDGVKSGKGNLSVDPQFANTNSGLILSNSSPCIDAGSVKVAHFMKTDILGLKWDNKAPNIGAYLP